MNNNVFESVDAIDEALDKEYGELANNQATEDNEKPTEENTGSEGVEETSVEKPEENKEDAPNPNDKVQNEVQEEPKDDEGKSESKKDYAFAQLRTENGNLKKERDGYKADSDFLKELASNYGYTDVSKFQEALREARIKKEAENKGYDYELYKRTVKQEERITQLEKERAEEITNKKLDRFKSALDEAVKTYEVSEDEIFDRLENSGISVDDVLSISNPKLILDGILIDKVQNNARQSQIQDLQNMNGLVEDKNEQSGTVNPVTIESLLKDDLAEYKKNNIFI